MASYDTASLGISSTIPAFITDLNVCTLERDISFTANLKHIKFDPLFFVAHLSDGYWRALSSTLSSHHVSCL